MFQNDLGNEKGKERQESLSVGCSQRKEEAEEAEEESCDVFV